MSKLILHVGTHKTGTTSIQSLASSNRDELMSKGLCYPDPVKWFKVDARLQSANAHFSFANALARYNEKDQRQLSQFRDHISESLSKGMDVLVSAESLCRHILIEGEGLLKGNQKPNQRLAWHQGRAAFIARLAEYLEGLPVEVVMYLRRPDSFMESMYSESISSTGNILDFDRFLKSYAIRLDYNLQIKLFARYWKLKLFNFEEKKTELPFGFFASLGLPVPSNPSNDIKRTAVPKAAVLWMHAARQGRETTDSERKRRWTFALQDENRVLFHADEASTFWKSEATRDKFLASAGLEFGNIRFNGPSRLPATCSWSAAEHVGAERLFAQWVMRNSDWLAERDANYVHAIVNPQAPNQIAAT